MWKGIKIMGKLSATRDVLRETQRTAAFVLESATGGILGCTTFFTCNQIVNMSSLPSRTTRHLLYELQMLFLDYLIEKEILIGSAAIDYCSGSDFFVNELVGRIGDGVILPNGVSKPYTYFRTLWLNFIIDTITEELKHEPIYWDTTGDSPSLL